MQKKILFFFFFTTNIGYGAERKSVYSNLPKQASVGKVCISMYVANTNPLSKFSFAKHPKEKEKQGFPKPDKQVAHHRILMSLPTLSQVQTSVGWVSSWNHDIWTGTGTGTSPSI